MVVRRAQRSVAQPGVAPAVIMTGAERRRAAAEPDPARSASRRSRDRAGRHGGGRGRAARRRARRRPRLRRGDQPAGRRRVELGAAARRGPPPLRTVRTRCPAHRPGDAQRGHRAGSTGHGRRASGSGFVITAGRLHPDQRARGRGDRRRLGAGHPVRHHDASPARVVGRDPESDLAVLKVDRNNLQPVEFGDSDAVAVGDGVLAIGSPLALPGTVTSGIVSALDRTIETHDAGGVQRYYAAIQTDAAVNRGNSGGPLFDLGGPGHRDQLGDQVAGRGRARRPATSASPSPSRSTRPAGSPARSSTPAGPAGR